MNKTQQSKAIIGQIDTILSKDEYYFTDFGPSLEIQIDDIIEKWDKERLGSWDTWREYIAYIIDTLDGLDNNIEKGFTNVMSETLAPIIQHIKDADKEWITAFEDSKDWVEKETKTWDQNLMGGIEWVTTGIRDWSEDAAQNIYDLVDWGSGEATKAWDATEKAFNDIADGIISGIESAVSGFGS
ncbi:unnamed protein product, partial [marine sediment metagenome]